MKNSNFNVKNIVILFLLASVLFCSSCIVTFENPVFDLQSSTINQNLLGKWKIEDKDEVFLEFSSNSTSQTILKIFEENGESEKNIFSVSPVKLGKFDYLSLRIIDEDQTGENTFLIVRYQLSDNELKVWLHDKEKIKKLIEAGKLKETPKNYGEISISNSSEELKEFLESNESDELFVFLGQLKKA